MTTTTLPSYYLGDLERKRKRSAELSAGLGEASKSAMGSMDLLQKLEEKLYGRKQAEDKTAREIEQQGVANTRADRLLALQERLGQGRLEAATTAAAEKRAAEEARAKAAGEAATTKAAADRRKAVENLIAKKIIQPHMFSPDEWDALFPGVPQPKAPVAVAKPVDPMKAEADRARREKAITEAERAKLKLEQERSPPPKPMDRVTRDKIAEYDANIEALQSVADRAKDFDFGPVSSKMNDLAQMLGVDDAGFTRIKADLANQISAIISALSGAAVPKDEFERLKRGLPQPGDGDTAFMQKLLSTIENFKRMRKYLAGGAVSTPTPMAPDISHLTPEEKRARLEELRAKAAQP